jgi:response regulator RpfG family c-di-GMP phosphodiesterase
MKTVEMNTSDFKKIMYVDDDMQLVNSYKSFLKSEKLSDYMIHFKNAKDSIQYLKSIKNKNDAPDYILLDFYMPDMEGYEFLTYFEKLVKIKDSVEIYVSTSTHKKIDRDTVMKFPFVNAFIEKPVSSEFILLLIKGHV